jgi:hypothetical protein
MNTVPFNLRLLIGKASVEISEQEAIPASGERLYSLSSGGTEIGTISFPPYYWPHIAVDLPLVCLWGGLRLFFFDLRSPQIRRRDHDDELLAVYQLSSSWCLVGETTVVTVDDPAGPAITSYLHDEVITRSWWVGSILWIEDFRGRRFSFDPVTSLRPRSE